MKKVTEFDLTHGTEGLTRRETHKRSNPTKGELAEIEKALAAFIAEWDSELATDAENKGGQK